MICFSLYFKHVWCRCSPTHSDFDYALPTVEIKKQIKHHFVTKKKLYLAYIGEMNVKSKSGVFIGTLHKRISISTCYISFGFGLANLYIVWFLYEKDKATCSIFVDFW